MDLSPLCLKALHTKKILEGIWVISARKYHALLPWSLLQTMILNKKKKYTYNTVHQEELNKSVTCTAPTTSTVGTTWPLGSLLTVMINGQVSVRNSVGITDHPFRRGNTQDDLSKSLPSLWLCDNMRRKGLQLDFQGVSCLQGWSYQPRKKNILPSASRAHW